MPDESPTDLVVDEREREEMSAGKITAAVLRTSGVSS